MDFILKKVSQYRSGDVRLKMGTFYDKNKDPILSIRNLSVLDFQD